MNSDLAKHALQWRFNGLPRYGDPDEDGDREIVGVVAEPIWHLDALTPNQQQEFGQAFFALLDERDRRGRGESDARVYAVALEEWGIACPHPPHWREPIGDDRHPGFACAACLCWVVPTQSTG